MGWSRDFAGGHSLGDRHGRILTDWDSVDDGGRIFRTCAVAGMLPDITDPATLGCMLALARQAWADPTLHVVCVGERWWAVSAQFRGGPGHETEGDALAAAIIAAPE